MIDQNRRDGFVRLYAATRNRLQYAAYLLCGDWHEAEDLVQIATLKLYDRQFSGDTDDKCAMAYFRRAVYTTYLDERRRHRWRNEITQAAPPDGPQRVDPAISDRVALMAAVGKLGATERAIIVLRFWADLTVEQTSTVLGCPAGTVTSHTHRALTALRGMLDRADWRA
jgi:RNA polymerase sigma factor (sigma-70 family)